MKQVIYTVILAGLVALAGWAVVDAAMVSQHSSQQFSCSFGGSC